LTSSARLWAPLARFIDTDRRVAAWASAQGPAAVFGYEFVRFGLKQAWACLFGGAMVALLLATAWWYPRSLPLARYDALFLAALAIQAGMLAFRLETLDEAKVILVFHVVGTVMEVFKTSVGSWIYPEPSFFRIAGVPLFTGFMYAAVGSYIARAWRLFDFRFTRYPPFWTTVVLALAIYANFFSHHYAPDLRAGLFAAYAVLFGPTTIYYTIHRARRHMPVLVATLLVALFIWIAENVGTYSRAWIYPSQKDGWAMVSLAKLGSWYLLMIISVVLVTLVNRPKSVDGGRKRWPWGERPSAPGNLSARATRASPPSG
jgi:uncharacterized membrane protein YoaT (DUF817 family)